MDSLNIMHRMGITTIPNDILETENKVVKLVEVRGVAASPYVPVAKKIVEYIKKQCNQIRFENNKISFDIPQELTSKIDFIENLKIHVNVENIPFKDYYYNSGSAKSFFSINDDVVNNKFVGGQIVVDCISCGGVFDDATFFNNFYHELNHYYDAYKDLVKNGGYSRFIKQLNKSNLSFENLFNNEKDNDLFNLIVYRLFSETELNALVAGVYGDLQAINSKRENFKNDIQNTQAYYIYKEIANNYKALYSQIDDKASKKIAQALNLKPYEYGLTTDTIVKELKRKTKFLLKQLIKGIGRTASLYYDKSEYVKPNMIITHIDKPTIINND